MGYAIANTNNNKQNSSSIHFFFPNDSLIKKKKSTDSKIKYNNQNPKSKHKQKSSKIENIKKKKIKFT